MDFILTFIFSQEQPAAISPSISQPLSRSSTPGYNPTQQPVMQLPQQSPQVAAPYQGQQVPQPSQFQPPQMGLSSQPQMHSLQQQQQFQPPPQSYNSPQHHQNMLQNQMQPNQSLQVFLSTPFIGSKLRISKSALVGVQ